MRLTTKGRFAVTAMIDLAMREHLGPVTLAGIADRQDISLSYLEQLFGKLRRNAIVESTRGPGGGYSLARKMSEISAADIVFAVDEPLDATRCRGKSNCTEAGPCMTHELWMTLNQKMVEYLQSVKLSALVESQKGDEGKKSRKISVLKEHRAALEFPTSTLQKIKIDQGHLSTV